MNYRKIQKKLYKTLDANRYQHTLGVMYTCAALAMVYHVDLAKAQYAGLLHDCAKCMSDKKMLKKCRKYKIPVTSFEEKNPFLLHGKLGAYLAKKDYGVEDEEVKNAIVYHTTGKADMCTLEKITYIADYIEPSRNHAPRLEELRALAYHDLDECMYEILKDTLEYLKDSPKNIDPLSAEAFQYYKELHQQKQQKGEL